MNPNFNFDAEGVFDQPIKPICFKKRRATVHTNRYAKEIAAARDCTNIMRTMRCPKLLSSAMPRVILKEEYLQRPRSAESEFGVRFVPPNIDEHTGHAKVVKNFESGEPERKPDKYFFNSVQIDPVQRTARVKKPVLIFAESALGTAVEALFKPSTKAARKLRDADRSPFSKK